MKEEKLDRLHCGALLEGTSLSELSEQLFDYVLRVANGEQVNRRRQASMIWRSSNRA